MSEKCETCKHYKFDDDGGYFYTEICNSCREKPRYLFYEKRGTSEVIK